MLLGGCYDGSDGVDSFPVFRVFLEEVGVFGKVGSVGRLLWCVGFLLGLNDASILGFVMAALGTC